MKTVKTCSKCKIEKPVEDFGLCTGHETRRRYRCLACEREYQRNYNAPPKTEAQKKAGREYFRRRMATDPAMVESRKYAALKRKYGLEPEEFDARYAACGGLCEICGNEPCGHGELHVDHCHDTGKVRGLLCMKCNMTLGRFGDNVEGVRRFLEYLERQ